MQGLHILAEFHGCAGTPAALTQAASLSALCRAACREAGLAPVAEAFHQFPDAGATGAVVLAESHLAIHTWPELGAVTLDLYVCNFSRDNHAAAEAAFAALQTAFRPARVVRRDIARGELPGDAPAPPGIG